MTSLFVLPLPTGPSTRPPSEADLFRARAASAERRLRRRRWLRLRAAVFGRAKLAPGRRRARPRSGRRPAERREVSRPAG